MLSTGTNAPTGLTATAASDSEIDLVWTNDSAVSTGFEVFRGDSPDSLTSIATLSGAGTTYMDSNLVLGTQYFYAVRTLDAGSPSPLSAIASAFTLADPPLNLSTGNPDTQGAISLSWTNVSPFATEIELQIAPDASASGPNFTQVVSLPANSTSYTLGGLGDAQTYWFRARAVVPETINPWSNTASATTLPAPMRRQTSVPRPREAAKLTSPGRAPPPIFKSSESTKDRSK